MTLGVSRQKNNYFYRAVSVGSLSAHQLTNEARAETKFTLVMPCKEEEDRKSTSQAEREL